MLLQVVIQWISDEVAIALVWTDRKEPHLLKSISADCDQHIGSLIPQTMEGIGKEAVKEGCTVEDEIEITEGMKFDHRFISPYFVTDVKEQKVEFDKALLFERQNSFLQDKLLTLETANQARRPLLVTAEDVDGEALATCISDRLRGQLQVSLCRQNAFGDNRKSILGDLAIQEKVTVYGRIGHQA
jgi:chaperonin GroEL